MDLINNLSLGFGVAFTFQNLIYCFVGCLLVWCLRSKHQIIETAARATDAKMVSALLCHTKGLGS